MMSRRRVSAPADEPLDATINVDERRREDLLDLLATVGLVGPASEQGTSPVLQQLVISKFNPFTQSSLSSQALVDSWISILDGEVNVTVTDLLFIEFWASIGYSQVRLALSGSSKRFKYTQTLFAIRRRVAFALYDYAKNLNWRQPVTFVSALKAARAYLRDAAGHSGVGSARDYGQFTGKLGVATVLIAGFEAITEEEALEAYEAIRISLEYENDATSALPYLIGAATLNFDCSSNLEQLQEALEFSQTFGLASKSIPLHLAVAQAQLRIAICTADENLLSRISSLVAGAEQRGLTRVTDFLTTKILKGIIDHLRTRGFTGLVATQLRVPFGYRTGDDTHPLLIASAKEVFAEIRNSQRLDDPMVAELLADLVVNCRSTLGIDEVQALTAAVKYRKADRGRSGVGLVRAQNELELASIERDPEARLIAAESLAVIAADARYTAAAQMVLAHNVESWGPLKNDSALRGTTGLVATAANGTARDLWLLASRSALENANLIRRSLGGRSSVTTVGDYYGLVTETFVFKEVPKVNYQRGSARSERIQRALAGKDLNAEFGVPAILDAKENSDSTVVLAHRFVSGTSLMELFETADATERLQLAVKAARFLGLINSIEAENVSADGVRKTLKSKEVGRFLRSCGVENYLPAFDKWWDAVKGVDNVTRKDAHLDNWLLGEGGRLIAIDWEAIGCRPVGFELAQITDDHPYFPVEDWDVRRTVFDAYLAQIDHIATVEECWRAYKAGVLARHLWAITSPERAKSFFPGQAETRLAAYARTVGDDVLASVARSALQALLDGRGLAEIPAATKNTTGSGRVRLSKKLAYLLRHRLDLERDESGWVQIAALVEVLGNVSDQEVATVATDAREARFELRGKAIRARYGHSAELKHEVLFDNTIPPEMRLYHASPWMFASEILDLQRGLQPKSRGMVHLTDSFQEAVASGVRGGHPLVFETAASRLSQVARAGELTFLTPDVPASSLRVVPMSSYWTNVPALGALVPGRKDTDRRIGQPGGATVK